RPPRSRLFPYTTLFRSVVSRFNELVTRELLAGARETLLERGVPEEGITVVWVPGAWEIPSALARLSRLGRFDALIALGAVIRGEDRKSTRLNSSHVKIS